MPSSPAPLSRHVVRAAEGDAQRFAWGSITWLDNAALTGSQTLTAGLVVIDPGRANPEHYHPNCDEVLYVLEGSLTHTLGDQRFDLSAGDLIHIPQGVPHQGINRSAAPCRVLVTYNTGRRETVVTQPGESLDSPPPE